VAAFVTSPNVTSWSDDDLWTGARHNEVPIWEFKTFYKEACHWWEWLLHESPWRDVYLTKPSPEEAGVVGVHIDVNVPSNLAMFATIATRHPHEYPARVRAWSRGVAMGGDPAVLSLLVEGVDVRGEEGDLLVSCDHDGGGIHDMYSHRMIDKNGIRQFVKWRLKSAHMNDPLTVNGRYGGIHCLFSKEGDNPFRDKLADIKKDKFTTVNRFDWADGMRTTKRRVLSFDAAVEGLSTLSKEIRSEYG
jgi:hypothetical protein